MTTPPVADRFTELSAVCARAGVHIWKFADAPPEYQAMSMLGGGEEFVFYVSPFLLDSDGDFDAVDELLSFLDFLPKSPEHCQYAGDELGWYNLVELPDGGRVAITSTED